VIDLLRADGIAVLPEGLDARTALATAEHLRRRPCYPGHVKVYGDGAARSYEEVRRVAGSWTHDLADVLEAPGFWELILRSQPLAALYLGVDRPRLYSVNAFWTRPDRDAPIQALQTLHRDADDDRFIALFVYGTDVLDDDDGPHVFRAGSHRNDQAFGLSEVRVYGRAGTAFLADTRGLHRGLKPVRQDRLLLWARWGVSERPWAYVNDRTEPVKLTGRRFAVDPKTRSLVELILV